MVSAASYPPLQKSQGRGTLSFETGSKKPFRKGGPPATVGDRTLTFEYKLSNGDATSVPVNVTARKFAYLTNNSPSNTCNLPYGTNRNYVYSVYTHPDGQPITGGIAQGTPVTESFSPALTCETGIGNTTLGPNSGFTDNITSLCSSKPLTCTQKSTQTLSVDGYTVRTNTLQWTSTGVSYTNNGPKQ